MEKFPPNIFWMKGGKSRHQFQINRKDYISMVPIPVATM
jgi:hypothetical protein